ncbi:MAG: ABC transporter permease [Ectothiorhodospiraceae bacterium]|nr:ABC transporter permease [Ectothiorhodospiraceae bacterium]
MSAVATADAVPAGRVRRAARWLWRRPIVLAGLILIGSMVVLALASPIFATHDPIRLNPTQRLKPPSAEHWFGTDQLGRDVYSRVVYGSQISLLVGFSVAFLSTVLGLAIGLVTGFVRKLDAVIMRIMDGLMAIPSILLAIALISLSKSSVENVIIAITIPEVPRMVRLVRSVVLTLREQLFVDAAVSLGAGLPRILALHIMPNTIAPLIVQATYVCASAIIIEAILSFLGAGTPPDIPSWGNIMAEGRTYVMIAFWILLFPGIFLTLVVLGVNLLGDGLRDTLDPRLRRSARNL